MLMLEQLKLRLYTSQIQHWKLYNLAFLNSKSSNIASIIAAPSGVRSKMQVYIVVKLKYLLIRKIKTHRERKDKIEVSSVG